MTTHPMTILELARARAGAWLTDAVIHRVSARQHTAATLNESPRSRFASLIAALAARRTRAAAVRLSRAAR